MDNIIPLTLVESPAEAEINRYIGESIRIPLGPRRFDERPVPLRNLQVPPSDLPRTQRPEGSDDHVWPQSVMWGIDPAVAFALTGNPMCHTFPYLLTTPQETLNEPQVAPDPGQ